MRIQVGDTLQVYFTNTLTTTIVVQTELDAATIEHLILERGVLFNPNGRVFTNFANACMIKIEREE